MSADPAGPAGPAEPAEPAGTRSRAIRRRMSSKGTKRLGSGPPLQSISSRAFSARPLLNRFLGFRFAPPQALVQIPKFGIVLVVVLVLDQWAFSAAKRARLSAIILSSLSDCQTSGFSRTKDDDEHEDGSSTSEFRLSW
jgi:hypothetical protein